MTEYIAPPIRDTDGHFQLNIQLHKGSSTTVSNSYTPSEEEKEATALQNEYTKAIMPNALALNTSAGNLFFDSLADTPVDYASLLEQAQAQNNAANAGYTSLANGELPSNYVQNMTDAIQSGVTNTMGSTLNSLASRGVLNSSVTNTAMNDISKNVSDTMAEQYSNNISQLSNIYGNLANNAGNGITLGAAGQEAAVTPATTAWNMSLGLGNSGNSTLSALAGKGTSTQTTTTSGGSGLLSGLLGIGTSLGSAAIAACFTDDTKIKMADGTEKRISNVQVGDEVQTYDDELADTSVGVVEALSTPVYQVTYAVVCTDNKNAKKAVYTTLTQPLLTEDDEFVEVGLMRLGTKLKGAGKVVGIVESGERKVYDIKVSGTNNYYANGFIAYGMFEGEK